MGKIFRTKETEALYTKEKNNGGLKECPLCNEPSIKEWNHWKIIKNKFPYDLIAKDHDMLVSKRHVGEEDLTQEEFEEMLLIKKEYIHSNYGYMFEPMMRNKSIPDHFHTHLINEKEILV
tara:strand:+ start:20873 stop:21232 length:360 start_codon:yes stop_codon:yes gene_type:complete